VRSYLAAPVISRSGEVIGGLFFGHSETKVFTERSERIVAGVAAQAAIAIDNARLYEAAQREITERKRVADELQKAKEELSHHAEDLEKQVSARTASLREALSQLEEFSYSVSHDLRAPLRAIVGYGRVFREDYGAELPEEANEYLDKISRSAQRMERLVNEVLTLSRVTRADLQLHPVRLQQFIDDLVEQNPLMHPPAADVKVATPHTVMADEARLGQAISNLLSNAVKFVAPGENPVVRVRSEDLGERVRIWVEDHGIGIPMQHRGKLFGMFQRLPSDQTYEGTGIGLAIVRKAVEVMGGSVGIESNEPKGSRFLIELRKDQS
jgi:signal transduction histidine kinase